QQKSDVILDTKLTWADLERNLKSALKTEAVFGPNKSVTDIGEGNGFVSRCGMVVCDWVNDEGLEKLPSRIVIKIPSVAPFRKLNDSLPKGQRMLEGGEELWALMEGKLREAHDIEVATYEFFEAFNDLSVPVMYYGVMFGREDTDNGQICLELVENSKMMRYHENHTVEQVRQIVRALGKIQACSLKKELTATELQRNFFEEFAKTVTLEGNRGNFKALLTLDSSEKTAKLWEEIDKLLPEYYAASLPTTIHAQLGFRPVLVNGDLRTENVLIHADSGDLSAFIDWQTAHLGVGVEDLIRITLFALTAEERRASASMLVAEMYDCLVQNLDGTEPPYTLEVLRELYDLLFPHCAFFFAGPCIMLITNQASDPKLSAAEKERRKEVELVKVLASLEDAVEYDAKNKQS
ncbi:hypothetical protein PFISCL1PPCAC_23165, partial [Pristionchus fissidentatus]